MNIFKAISKRVDDASRRAVRCHLGFHPLDKQAISMLREQMQRRKRK